MLRIVPVLAALAVATPAAAQEFDGHLKARQGMFRIMAINLGIIGDMAKGETEYDAEMAQTAADNLVAVGGTNPLVLFPEGSSNEALEGTRALPALWDDTDDVLAKWSAFGEAASGLQQVAGDGREALGPALGPVGDACSACHDEYRASDE